MASHNALKPTCTIKSSLLFPFLSLVFLVNSLAILAATTSSSSSLTQNYKTYVKQSCYSKTVLYPQICYKSLSSYASKIKSNPKKLCSTALSIALKSANNASSGVSKLSKKADLTRSEVKVIQDCLENMKDSIIELKQSLNSMSTLGNSDQDLQFQLSNIKTWVSAALTDENTCTDGFEGQKLNPIIKFKIRNFVLNVSMLTSNALALVNSLTY